MEAAKWTGQRVREVSTSFISSLSLASNHWGRKGPDKAERKVRGEPSGLRFRTGAEEEETDEETEDKSDEESDALSVVSGFVFVVDIILILMFNF